ncbi:MAG: FtsX-like permease family protein, partial [Ktedonobacterales bacterium]
MGRSTILDSSPQLPDGQQDAGEIDTSQRDSWLWHLWHGNALAPARLALLRMRHGWRMLATTGAGMLVAVTLICMVPLYSILIANIQLRHALTSAPPSQINIATFVDPGILLPTGLPDVNDQVEAIRQQELGAFAPNDSIYLQSKLAFNFVELNGKNIAKERPDLGSDQAELFAYYYQQALPHMQVLEGRLPQDVPVGQPPEVLATPELKAHIGDLITLEEGATFQQVDEALTRTRVRVVGIWFPKHNITDPFWNGVNFEATARSLDGPLVYKLLFTQKGLLGALASLVPSPHVMVVYLSFTQAAAFDTSDVQLYLDRLARYRVEISHVYGATVGTSLDKLIQQVQEQRGLLDLPLASVVALIEGLALLFVVVMAGTLLERQRGEIATLTSRGASRTQVLVSFVLQSVLLALLLAPVGLLVAPTLALLLAGIFIPGSASVINPGLVLRVMPLPTMLLLSLAGVLLSSLAVLLAAWQTTRLDVLALRRAAGRGGGAPVWQRAYLDVGLIVVCVAGYLELSQFGSLNVRAQLAQVGLGSSQSIASLRAPDPLLLLTPVLLLLAGGVLLLRLFPLVARLGAWLATGTRGAAGMLAFSHVARVTAQFSRLALLLTLSVALGLFAIGFDTSLTVNATQRAAYEAGGDVRIGLSSIASGSAFAADIRTSYTHLPGVTAVTPLYRTYSNVTTGDQGQNVDTLGIDPTTFGQVAQASWRTDYADQPLVQLLDQMRAHTIGTASAGQREHPIWVLIDDVASATLHLGPGSRFSAIPFESNREQIAFVVGAVVHHFPTLYSSNERNNSTGYVVADQQDLIAAFQHISNRTIYGPTEYWLRTTANSAETHEREQQLATNPDLY